MILRQGLIARYVYLGLMIIRKSERSRAGNCEVRGTLRGVLALVILRAEFWAGRVVPGEDAMRDIGAHHGGTSR
jgi:hypothetical protein